MAKIPSTSFSAENLVSGLYEALLQRDADEAGLQQKTERLTLGDVSIVDLIREMIGSEEFAEKLPSFLQTVMHQPRLRFTNDVSQYGEIWKLIQIWINAQAVCGLVVDVGARGRDRSNSYDLMRHFGWQGLLIEANPGLMDTIKNEFSGLDAHFVSCAVSDYNGRATFTLGSNNDVSSLDPGLAANWGATKGKVDVEVRRLADVLDEHDIPETFDLLSLDIEGEDIKVLNDLIDNSSYRPRWIIIEASDDYRVKRLTDAPFSAKVRRSFKIVASTSANLILCAENEVQDAWRRRPHG